MAGIKFYRNKVGGDWSLYLDFHWFYIRIARCCFDKFRIFINK